MDRQDAINAMAVVYPEIDRDVLGDILAYYNNDVDRACSQLLATCTPNYDEQAAEEERQIELAIAASLAKENRPRFLSQADVEQIAAVQIQIAARSWICQQRIHTLRSLSLGNTPVDVRRRCLESLESAATMRRTRGRTSRMMTVGGSLKNALMRATSRQRIGFEGFGDAATRERLIKHNDGDHDQLPGCEWQPPLLLLATQATESSSDSVQSSPRDVTVALHDVAMGFEAAEQTHPKTCDDRRGLLSAEERYASRVGRAKAANAAKKKAAAAVNSATPLLLAIDG